MTTKGTKNKKIEQSEAKHVLEATKDLNLTKVIGEVGDLQVDVQNTLAGLSASLTNKVQQLEQMNTAISLKEQRLKELYDIENMAITLDDMKAQRENEELEYSEQKSGRIKDWLDQDAERNKKWKRELEEYEYTRSLSNKKCKDDFDAEVATNKRNEQIRQEMLNKSWSDREGTLKIKEQDMLNLQKQVGEFEVKLKNEVAKAETILGNSLKKEHGHQVELLRKDAEARVALDSMKIAAQEKAIQGLHEQISTLQIQLSDARKDAKEIASSALQSASGRQVADALSRVVEQREPNTGKK